MKTLLKVALPVIALLAATPASAQMPSPAVAKEKIALLNPLVGSWRGGGWIILPGGVRSEFDSTETVASELDGTILLVRGKHFDKAEPKRVIHDALATIAWNQQAGTYRFHSHLATGVSGDYALTTDGKSFDWGIDLPGGRKLRYRTDFTNNIWHEVGETSTDGTSWTKYFEMTLKRVD